MSAEFPTHSQIETIRSPYRHEPGSGVAIALTKNELREAGKRIKGLWSSFVDCGIGQALAMAQLGGKIVNFEASDARGVAWYQAKFAHSGIDRVTIQPVDVFHLIKENPDRNEPPVKMTVVTYNGQKTRYSRLVAMETEEDAAEQVTGHYFHFDGDDLVRLTQTSRPETLFPAPGIGETQIIRISRETTPELTDLQVQIGFTGSPKGTYSYEYVGHDYVATRGLRVADRFAGELEMVDIGPDGIIRDPVTFSLPQAVANIANFEPAIAV